MDQKLSEYEETAKQQIWGWKNHEQTWFDKAMEMISWPSDKAREKLLNMRNRSSHISITIE